MAQMGQDGLSVHDVAAAYVAAYNAAVERADFDELLAGFTDDAGMRFENVPGAGTLEFVGRAAYSEAYERQPPDDQIKVTGAVREEQGTIVISFAWTRDGAPGELRLTLEGDLVSRMIVAFV